MVRPVPKLQIRSDFEWVTDNFRAEMNAYLLERFGTKQVAYIIDPGALKMFGRQMIVVSPEALARL